MTKRILLILVLSVSTASAADFTFSINAQRVLDALPAICIALRAELPLDQRTPWSQNICMKNLAIVGAKAVYERNEDTQARLEMRQRIDAARDALEPTPVALPTPTATPTAVPTP